MFSAYLSTSPVALIITWALQALSYFFLLKRMNLRKWTCLIPPLADRQFSKVLFKRMSSFYRPFLISAVFLIAALYLGRSEVTAGLYLAAVFIIYGIFWLRLYYRIAKSFGKKGFFRILTALFPVPFLLILGLGKAKFTRPVFKSRVQSRAGKWLVRAINVLITGVEVAAVTAVIAFLTVKAPPPISG